ncbi:hypothetical protein Tco_0678497 [Tanacetum coccineum]|uniref:Uncharacterized protein n=1 Tax=Tanacetum coccineum TaxID=301880 RepID=A0ABQ4XG55_9ASTR
MLVQGLFFQGEGSTVPVESHHTPTDALSTSPPHISPTLRTDEAASTGVDVRHIGDATTVTSLDAGQGSGMDLEVSSKAYEERLNEADATGSIPVNLSLRFQIK